MNAQTQFASPISREAALRLALAARALPGISVPEFVRAIGERFGLPVTEATLSKITVKDIKEALQGDDVVEPDIPAESFKAAVRLLWGEGSDNGAPKVASDVPEIARSLRVAVASNTGENLDGHFGSCLRFLVYQVAAEGIWLVDVRSTLSTEDAEDKNAARAALIADCNIVCVQSIGGPAAAKVIRANIHPLKFPQSSAAAPELLRIQTMLANPPPWIARALGEETQLASRYACAGDTSDEDD